MANQDKVIILLNDVLCAELTAINQYFLFSKICQNQGYNKLAKKVREDSIDEMKHADEVIARILYLKGIPNVQKLGAIKVGENVTEQFQADLGLEQDAVSRLNKGIVACQEAGDNGTRLLLETILKSEEEHVDWLETQLELIKQLGEKHYLLMQM